MKKIIILVFLIFFNKTIFSEIHPESPQEVINNALNKIGSFHDALDDAINKVKISLQQKYANNETVTVQTGFTDENRLIANRQEKIKESLKNFLNNNNNENLKIAFSGSGGGYRAMIYTLGALQGAKQTGLLDITLYMSALSGSTWALNAWLASGESVDSISNSIKNSIEKNYIVTGTKIGSPVPSKIDEFNQPQIMLENFYKKYLFNQDFTSIDIWGAAIANNTLKKQDLLLSQQAQKVESGDWIYPINTAVHQQQGADYHWYEFTPFDVRNLNTNQFIPISAFGRTFENNKSTNNAPEQALSFYLGTFGSAFAVSPEEILRIGNVSEVISEELSTKIVDEIFENTKLIKNHLMDFMKTQNLPTSTPTIPAITKTIPGQRVCVKYIGCHDTPAKTITITPEIPGIKIPQEIIDNSINSFVDSKIESAKGSTRQTIKNELKKNISSAIDKIPSSITGFRLFPAKLPGFIQDQKDLTLIDAGIDANIPLIPLVKRQVDAIIVFDGSETVKDAPELEKALNEMEKNKQIDLKNYDNLLPYSKYGSSSFSVIKGINNAVPTIIYIPMVKDIDLIKDQKIQNDLIEKGYFTKNEINNLLKFDPVKCTKEGDCNTFNFKYSKENFENLFNLGKFNVIANIENIKKALS